MKNKMENKARPTMTGDNDNRRDKQRLPTESFFSV